jgi:hypothetical protein
MSTNYSQYLGARKCCDLKVQGPQGPQGAQGPSSIGPTGFPGATGATGPQGVTGRGCRGATGAQGYQGYQGYQGATGPTGAQGFQGETGGTPWIEMNGIGPQGAGYTGIGITGQDVLIYGNLLVTGGIDPIYLALTPQPNGPQGFTNPLWVDNSGFLRSENITATSYTSSTASIYNIADGNIATINEGIYNAKIRVKPYNSVAPSGGQVQIGSGIDTTNNAGRIGIAIGTDAAAFNQGNFAIAIGSGAGYGGVGIGQGVNAIAIGADSGVENQQGGAIAIGNNSGGKAQGANSVALGRSAGEGTTSAMGANAVAIGFRAGLASQVAGSICLNASGAAVNPDQAGFFVNPIRAGALGSSFTPQLPAGVLYYSGNEVLRTT